MEVMGRLEPIALAPYAGVIVRALGDTKDIRWAAVWALRSLDPAALVPHERALVDKAQLATAGADARRAAQEVLDFVRGRDVSDDM